MDNEKWGKGNQRLREREREREREKERGMYNEKWKKGKKAYEGEIGKEK